MHTLFSTILFHQMVFVKMKAGKLPALCMLNIQTIGTTCLFVLFHDINQVNVEEKM